MYKKYYNAHSKEICERRRQKYEAERTNNPEKFAERARVRREKYREKCQAKKGECLLIVETSSTPLQSIEHIEPKPSP